MIRWRLVAGLICALNLVWPSQPVQALQFEQIPLSATEVVLSGRGPIVPGDTERLEQAVGAVPQSRQIVALALDSPGGNVAEAKHLVQEIKARRLPVVIPHNSKCASACFLLLAASSRRLAASDALIGIHSASENGAETETSLAVTTLMARDAADLGVPPALIGKMVETTPGRVEWLEPDDLALMHVTVFNGDVQTALSQPVPAAPVRRLAPVAPFAPSQASIPSGYAVGRRDRDSWEAWLRGLHGAYREGAISAIVASASCYGPGNVNRGDFTQGCEVARQRLAAVQAKLQIDPDYAAGWSAVAQPAPSAEPVEASFQGVLFCTKAARLTLQVYQQGGDVRRRALFTFGPLPASPEVPRGAYMVEGTIDLIGGAIVLTPARGVSQPPGFGWAGLSGRSDDGGKTFSGGFTESTTCSHFTLARERNTTAGR